jgi:cytidyltransferase-like protein
MNMIYPEGSVNGRFQPPHNGHLEYILAAKSQCRFLWVGITRYDIRDRIPSPVDPHREYQISNPLTYFERVQIITDMLLEANVPRGEFACTPFPIDDPGILPDFMSTSIPCFTTIFDRWNREKVARLENLGYKVIVLYERAEKALEGTAIRNLMLSGSLEWEKMVPPATVRAVHHLNLLARLAQIKYQA